MRTTRLSLLAAAISALACPSAGAQCEGQSLVEVLPPTRVEHIRHLPFQAPVAPGARWFLSVRRPDAATVGWVRLNGSVLVSPEQFAATGSLLRLEVALLPSNVLDVRTVGRGALEVSMAGVVPDESLAPGQGVNHVIWLEQFSGSVRGRPGPFLTDEREHVGEACHGSGEHVSISLPTTAGLYQLRVENGLADGRERAHAARVLWNGERVLQESDFGSATTTLVAPVAVVATNTLCVRVREPGASVRVVLEGYQVDNAPPTVTFELPEHGACLGSHAPVRAVYSDTIAGVCVDGIAVLANGQDVTSSVTLGEGSATANLTDFPPAALVEGLNRLTIQVPDRAGNRSEATVSFELDRIPPEIALSPEEGEVVSEDRPTLSAAFIETGCGLDWESLSLHLDGEDITPQARIDGATVHVNVGPLDEGDHVFTVEITDEVGNTASATSNFRVELAPVAFALSITPAGPWSVPAATENDLEIRAVTASGATATRFVGLVRLEVSDGLLPLHDLVVLFDPEDRGLLRIPRLAFFRTVGLLQLQALSLESPPLDIAGSLELNVTVDGPVLYPPLSQITNSPRQTIEGVSFPGQGVELLVDGEVVAATVANQAGQFSLAYDLADGEHSLELLSVDPATGQRRSSGRFMIVVDTVIERPRLYFPRDGVVLNQATLRGAAEAGSTVTLLEGTSSVGSAIAGSDGRFEISSVLSTGRHELRVQAVDRAENVSVPSGPITVFAGPSPLVVRLVNGGDASPQPVRGVPVELLGTTIVGHSDRNGVFVLLDAPVGQQIVSVRALPSFARIDIPVTVSTETVARVSPVLLQPIPRELRVPVELSLGTVTSATVVESPYVPHAEILLPAGVEVGGVDGPLEIAIVPVEAAASPAAFPAGFQPLRLFELSPTGATFTPGISARFPNLEGLPASTKVPLYELRAGDGGWVSIGTATADPTASYLETDGAIITSFSLFGFPSLAPPVATTYRLTLVDESGAPLSDQFPEVNTVALNEVSPGSGIYEAAATVSPNTVLRASVTLPVGGQAITVVTAPELATPGGITVFNGGQPLAATLTLTAGNTLGSGRIASTGTDDPALCMTDVAVHALARDSTAEEVLLQSRRRIRVDEGLLQQVYGTDGAASSPPVARFVRVPGGTSATAPETDRFLPFEIELADATIDTTSTPQHTATAIVGTLEYSLNDGPFKPGAFLTGLPNDPTSPLEAPPTGKRYLYVWDTQAGPSPVGSLFSPHEVTLRVSVADALGGPWHVYTAAETFFVQPNFPVEVTNLASGDLISDTQPVFEGTAAPQAEVDVFVDGAATNPPTEAIVGLDGTWSVQLAEALPPGSYTVLVIATELSGRVRTQTLLLRIRDADPPTFAAIADIVAEQTTPAGAVVSYALPVAADAVDPSPTISASPPPGTLFPPGDTIVQCTATDFSGNSATASFRVSVRDSTAPLLSQPPDVTVRGTGPGGAIVSFLAPIATDAADATPAVTCSPPSGSTFAPGTTTVTCTATDVAGNTAQVSFQVVVGYAPTVLLVDADRGDLFEDPYRALLDQLYRSDYDVWSVVDQRYPRAEDLARYELVVWITGAVRSPALPSEAAEDLGAFLDLGGGLLLASRHVVAGECEADFSSGGLHFDPFVEERLGVVVPIPNALPVELAGVGPAAGLTIDLTPLLPPDDLFQYPVRVVSPAAGLLESRSDPEYAATLRETVPTTAASGSRLVFWSFDVGDVDLLLSSPQPADRELLDRSLRWLDEAPEVRWSRPLPGEVDVPLNASFDLAFRLDIDPASLPGAIHLEDATAQTQPVTATFHPGTRVVRISPSAALSAATQYSLTVGPLATVRGATLPFHTLTFTTGATPDTAGPAIPAAPSVNVPGSGDGQIMLDLPALASSGETFRVYRRDVGATGAPNLVSDGPVRSLTFVDGTAADETSYEYALTAVDAAGNESALSPFVVARCADRIPPSLIVSWPVASAQGWVRVAETTIDVRGLTDDPSASIAVDVHTSTPGPNGAWERLGVALEHEGENAIPLVVTDPAGNRTAKVLVVERDTRAAKPDGVRAVVVDATTNRIDWLDSGEGDLVLHQIFRRVTTEPTWQPIGIAPAPTLSFEDDSVVAGVSYCYRVRAVDDLGNVSPDSDEACPPMGGAGGVGGGLAGGSVGPGGAAGEVVGQTSIGPDPALVEGAGPTRVRYVSGLFSPVETSGPPIHPDTLHATFGHTSHLIENLGAGPDVTIAVEPPPGYSLRSVQCLLFGVYSGLQVKPGNVAPGFSTADWDPLQRHYDVEWSEAISVSPPGATIVCSALLDTPSFTAADAQLHHVWLTTEFVLDDPADLENTTPALRIRIDGAQFDASLPVYPARENTHDHVGQLQPVDDLGGLLDLLTGGYRLGVPLFEGSGLGVNVAGVLRYATDDASWFRVTSALETRADLLHAPLGPGWSYPYGMRVLRRSETRWNDGVPTVAPSGALVYGPDGRPTLWTFHSSSKVIDGVTYTSYYDRGSWNAPGFSSFTEPFLVEDSLSGDLLIVEGRPHEYGFEQLRFDGASGRFAEFLPHGGAPPLRASYGGSIQRVVDSSGRQTSFEFESGGFERLRAIVDPTGSRWELTYRGDFLTSIREQSTGYGWSFDYDAETWFLSERQAPHGFVLQSTYDTARDGGARTHWGSLRTTRWKGVPGSTRVVATTELSSSPSSLIRRVSISSPSRRNTYHYDALAWPASIRGMEWIDLWDEDETTGALRSRGRIGRSNAHFVTQSFDALGFETTIFGVDDVVTRIAFPDGSRTTFSHDGAPGTAHAYRYKTSGGGNPILPGNIPQGFFTYLDPETRLERVATYGPPGQSESDPNPALYTVAYDDWPSPNGIGKRVHEIADPDGHLSRLQYAGVPNTGLVELEIRCVGEAPPITTTVKDPYRWKRTYDALGRLTSEVDPSLNETIFRYDEAGRLVEIEGPFASGQTPVAERPLTTYVWDGDLLAEIRGKVSASGEEVTQRFVYDARGRLIEHVQPGSTPDGAPIKFSYEYDDDGNLTKSTVPTAAGPATTTQEFDNRGNLKRVLGPEGEQVEFDYDERDFVKEVREGTTKVRKWVVVERDPMGRVRELDLPAVIQGSSMQPIAPRVSTRYDARGNVIRETYTYGRGNRTFEFEYDPFDLVVRESVEMARRQVAIMLDQTRDYLGGVSKQRGPHLETRPSSSSTLPIVAQTSRSKATEVTFDRDCFGDLIALRDGSLDTRVGFVRDLTQNVLEHRVPDPARPLGGQTPHAADTMVYGRDLDAFGQPRRVRDVFGETHELQHDLLGREVAMIDPVGVKTTTAYTPGGDVAATAVQPPVGTGARAATKVQYDEAGQPTLLDAPGDDGPGTVVEYDRSGRVKVLVDPLGRRTTLHYNEHGELTERVFASGARIVLGRDAAGRIQTVDEYDASNVLRRSERTDFDALGRPTRVEDDATWIEYEYDNLDRTTVKRLHFKAANLTHTLTYTYGEFGNLVSEKDSEGYELVREWDDEDNLVRLTFVPPASSGLQPEVVDFFHDRVGKLQKYELKPQGGSAVTTVGLTRDAKGRLTGLSHFDPTFQNEDLTQVTCAYDARDLRTRAELVHAGLTVEYGYDGHGFLVSERWRSAATGDVVHEERSGYDAAGNRIYRDQNGLVTRYSYDGVSQVSKVERQVLVRIPTSTITTTSDSFVTGFEDALANDGLVPDAVSAGSGWLSQPFVTDHWLELDVGAAKPVAAIEVSLPRARGTQSFLLQVPDPSAPGAWITLAADRALNGHCGDGEAVSTSEHTVRIVLDVPKLTSKLRVLVPAGQGGVDATSGQALPDALLNEVALYTIASETLVPTYDADGRLIKDGAFTYGYDVQGRMTELQGPGVHKRWVHTPEGLRASEHDVLAGTWRFFANDGDNVDSEFVADDQGGSPVGLPTLDMKYVSGLGADAHLGFLELAPAGGGGPAYRWSLRDGGGNVVQVLDAAGNLLDEHVRNAWGEDLLTPTQVTANPYGFAGRRKEPISGLYYHRARMYDPATGRFTSIDPAGLQHGPHLFVYGGNNPVNFRDPSGEYAGPIVGALLGAGVDVGMQLLTNGWDLSKIDGTRVLVSAAMGAATGGLAAFVGKSAQAARAGLELSRAQQTAVTGAKALLLAVEGYGAAQSSRAVIRGLEQGDLKQAALGAVGLLAVGALISRNTAFFQPAVPSAAARAQTRAANTQAKTGGGPCFLAGTLVSTAEGMRPIEQLRPQQDRVFSEDEHTGEQGYRDVVRAFRSWTDHVVYLRVGTRPRGQLRGRREAHRVGSRDGGQGSSEEGSGQEPEPDERSREEHDTNLLRTTPEHPFWRLTDRRFVRAADLQPGDLVRANRQGEYLRVLGCEVRSERAEVFNFEVEGWHTYFVAGDLNAPAVWVHNLCEAGLQARYQQWAAGRTNPISYAQYRQRWMAQRSKVLGREPGAGHVPHEGRAGVNLELSGRVGTLRRDPSGAADWVEAGTGRTIDLVGGSIPNQHFNLASVEASIGRHIRYSKGDITVVSGRGLNAQNRAALQAAVQRMQGQVPQGKQLWFGDY